MAIGDLTLERVLLPFDFRLALYPILVPFAGQTLAKLVQRIEQRFGGQADLVPADLDAQWEETAQRYAAQRSTMDLFSLTG